LNAKLSYGGVKPKPLIKGKKQPKSKASKIAVAFNRQTQMIIFAKALMASECEYLICFHG
jgi:hypothetical protein